MRSRRFLRAAGRRDAIDRRGKPIPRRRPAWARTASSIIARAVVVRPRVLPLATRPRDFPFFIEATTSRNRFFACRMKEAGPKDFLRRDTRGFARCDKH